MKSPKIQRFSVQLFLPEQETKVTLVLSSLETGSHAAQVGLEFPIYMQIAHILMQMDVLDESWQSSRKDS